MDPCTLYHVTSKIQHKLPRQLSIKHYAWIMKIYNFRYNLKCAIFVWEWTISNLTLNWIDSVTTHL